MKLKFISFIVVLVILQTTYSQTLVDNPCDTSGYPANAEWPLNGACVSVSTATFTPLYNPNSCNSGAVNDGWAWFTGNGDLVQINFQGDTGFDSVIHLFEVTSFPCAVNEIACADQTLNGGKETINTSTTSGVTYLIRIENWSSNFPMTGCLEVLSYPVTALSNTPCDFPTISEYIPGDPCQFTSTATFSPLYNPNSCGSNGFNDGWAWYTGTGTANTITYIPDPGVDIVLHLFETDLTCSVTEIDCANDNGAGGVETIFGGGTLGQRYLIRVQSVGSNAIATGCLGVDSTLGIIDNSFRDKIIVSPNPTDGEFSIDFAKIYENLFVRIVNIEGQEIYSKNYINSNKINLNIETSSGIYFIEISNKKMHKAVFKIIKI